MSSGRPGLQETSDKARLTIPLKGPVTKLASRYVGKNVVFGVRPEHITEGVSSVRPGSIHRRHRRTDGLRISGLP